MTHNTVTEIMTFVTILLKTVTFFGTTYLSWNRNVLVKHTSLVKNNEYFLLCSQQTNQSTLGIIACTCLLGVQISLMVGGLVSELQLFVYVVRVYEQSFCTN